VILRGAAARSAVTVAGLLAALCGACDRGLSGSSSAPSASRPVVLYCSADEQFARPLLAEFTSRTGIQVRPVFDTEAGKTTGLIERLRAERRRPIADVWWSSEIYGTLLLAGDGLLVPFDPATASDIPTQFRDADRRWTAFGLRGRALAFDPSRTPREKVPLRWELLADPAWRGRIAMANPLYGTTRGQMAQLLAAWGEERFRAYLTALAANGVRLADGNAHSVRMLIAGQVDLAMTDTDDIRVAKAGGASIDFLLPTVGDEGSPQAALWIPNSVGLVAGGSNPDGGRRLVEFLASADTEGGLEASESGNVPVRPELRRGGPGSELIVQAPDYRAGAARLSKSDELSRALLLK